MAMVARDVLWHWADEIDGPDPHGRGWQRSRLHGILLACERTGALGNDELERWRACIETGTPARPAAADLEAAEAFLRGALEDIRPMSRDEDPGRARASNRFHGALRALTEAGVISEEDRARWHQQELAASAPWLASEAVDTLASGGGFFAIGIPARTPEEEAADEAARQELQRLARRGALRRIVISRTPERHDGLAVIGVLGREECTEVLFHFVGPPHGDRGFPGLEAFNEFIDGLVAPGLSDDAGTTYEPAAQRPVGAQGTGGTPDPQRPQVITGSWRYFPPAPATASVFVADLGSARWTIS